MNFSAHADSAQALLRCCAVGPPPPPPGEAKFAARDCTKQVYTSWAPCAEQPARAPLGAYGLLDITLWPASIYKR